MEAKRTGANLLLAYLKLPQLKQDVTRAVVGSMSAPAPKPSLMSSNTPLCQKITTHHPSHYIFVCAHYRSLKILYSRPSGSLIGFGCQRVP